MKKHIIKHISLLLSVLICLSCFIGKTSVSAEQNYTNSAESNLDFAVKAAEIIKNNNGASMLRIMGKLRSDVENPDFPYVSDCAVSDDGRFVLQFSSENELVLCLEKLQNNPDVLYAERDIPVYTETLQKSEEHLLWGVEAIEADIYSQAITPSSGDSVTVAIVDSGSKDIDFIKDKLVNGYDFF